MFDMEPLPGAQRACVRAGMAGMAGKVSMVGRVVMVARMVMVAMGAAVHAFRAPWVGWVACSRLRT
jgi:hypothetical protein